MKKTKAQRLGITKFPYCEYDGNNNQTYYETSDGHWSDRKYDKDNNIVCLEYSNGTWYKTKYNGNCKYSEFGNETYYEDCYGDKEYYIV